MSASPTDASIEAARAKMRARFGDGAKKCGASRRAGPVKRGRGEDARNAQLFLKKTKTSGMTHAVQCREIQVHFEDNDDVTVFTEPVVTYNVPAHLFICEPKTEASVVTRSKTELQSDSVKEILQYAPQLQQLMSMNEMKGQQGETADDDDIPTLEKIEEAD
ncbi:MAG: uncharacterized protein KVP18_002065 [Porospora cf. gigantea A]|uniref:uncharacterized protein n=1 Tax=Porospora cf. gigantea A TaxID=2853593 RepID=UPI003559A815|nr:MAG: hypothetical protein KVP18_002065 [Porospora cf. gigantea A]